ncbi:MAG: hypothetical protein ACT4OY_04370 [Alphaproteobacteria bacterium]
MQPPLKPTPQLLPGEFLEILTRRYLPAVSLAYIVSVLGFAAARGDFFHYFFEDRAAYIMALVIALWVSIPALIWIFIRCLHYKAHTADDWYKITCGVLMLFLFVSYIMFPEAGFWGLRLYFAATLPVFLMIYLLLAKEGLSAAAAHPLTALGLTFLVHGALIPFIH